MQDFIISVFQYIINVILMPILIVAEFFYELIELLTCKKQKNPDPLVIKDIPKKFIAEMKKGVDTCVNAVKKEINDTFK